MRKYMVVESIAQQMECMMRNAGDDGSDVEAHDSRANNLGWEATRIYALSMASRATRRHTHGQETSRAHWAMACGVPRCVFIMGTIDRALLRAHTH